MKRISLLLAVMQYADNFTPRVFTNEISAWAKDSELFVFPFNHTTYHARIGKLKTVQYLQRIKMFYHAAVCCN